MVNRITFITAIRFGVKHGRCYVRLVGLEERFLATLKDVAGRAGVTPAVVSRLLNGDASLRVSASTRARVLQIASELDYSPNLAAVSLRLSQSNLIAIAVHDMFNPVYARIEEGAQAAAKERGTFLLVGDADALGTPDGHGADLIRGGGLGGLILQGTGAKTDQVLQRATHNSVPTVLLQEGGYPDLPVLRLPDERAAILATEHLISLGHRRVACLGAGAGLQLAVDRASGWRRTLLNSRLAAPEEYLVWAGSSLTAGLEGMTRLLARAPEVTAVVACNVVAAFGAVSAIVRSGRKVPDDISIIAIHDVALAEHFQPPLTVVDMPLRELGYRAIEMLVDHRPDQVGTFLVSEPAPRLIERESTRRV